MHGQSVSILSSGSCGNSILLRSNEEYVLIDAGISCRELERRMSFFGAEPTQVVGVVLTHEHTDHVRGARKFCMEHEVPAYATRGTLALTPLGGANAVMFTPNRSFSIGSFKLSPFKVKHLAAEPVALSVTMNSKKVGIASDLGCITPGVLDGLRDSELLLIEANYDEKMLLEGDYPEFLKRTIRGNHGHLSNDDAGILSAKSSTERTECIVLVHLSKENNTPEVARLTVEDALKDHKVSKKLEVAEHGISCGPFNLS
jgi:phosphoribosyl 1,2-cyclic phosphodiesterase